MDLNSEQCQIFSPYEQVKIKKTKGPEAQPLALTDSKDIAKKRALLSKHNQKHQRGTKLNHSIKI